MKNFRDIAQPLAGLMLCMMTMAVACSKAPETSTVIKGKPSSSFPPTVISSDAEDDAVLDYPIISAAPEQICSDVMYRGADGVLKIGRRACSGASACTLNGEKNCIASEDFPAVDLTGALAPNLGKIHANLTIFELTGTMLDCTSMGETGCYTAPGTAAVTPSSIDLSKILSGYTLLGVTGTLPTCSALVSQNCLVAPGRKAAVKCLDGDANCYLPPYSLGVESHKAFDISTLSASDIKSNVTIGGVTGTYPSAGVPLDGATDGFTDLDSATFSAQLASATTFAWFDREGVRHSRGGDTDLVSGNILDGVEVFGVTGNLKIPDPWNVRAGVSTGLVSGKMKMNCRNGFDLATFDMAMPKRVSNVDDTTNILTSVGHGYANGDQVFLTSKVDPSGLASATLFYVLSIDADTFKLSTTSGGAEIDILSTGTDVSISRWNDGAKGHYDTIDDFNNGGARVVSASGADETEFCSGVFPDTAFGLWEDVTPGTCNTLSDDCVFQDKITGLQWSEAMPASHFSYAYSRCVELDINGVDDWRLPTQKELLTASIHDIRSVNKALWLSDAYLTLGFWSSTAESAVMNYAVSLGLNASAPRSRDELFNVICVRGSP